MSGIDSRREREVGRVRAFLQRFHYPRGQMTLIVSLTAASGFFASMAMLHLGVHAMALRYPIAVGIAYGVFLLLLGLWLRWRELDLVRGLDVADVPSPGGGGSGASSIPDPPAPFEGMGGSSGGAGASGSFESVLVADASLASAPDPGSIVDTGSVLDFDLDGDELIAIALLLFVLATATVAALWLVWIAPTLLAELTVDAAIAAGLYRRVRGIESGSWVRTALRRTLAYFLVVAFVFGAAGYGLQRALPEVRSIGGVLQHLEGEQP